jgi:EmrB/QacA subfamily drug resistance transporter
MNRRHFLVLLTTIVGSGVVLLDGSVVNLALPALSKELHANFADLQWIADGYLLSLSALILLGGSLGDIFGRKKVYLIGLIGFGVSSALCGVAQSSESLIALRVVQGIFGALLVPGGLAIINTNFTAKKRGIAIGQWAAWSGIATAIGPFLGGFLIDNFSWRMIFFLNIPLVVICLLLALPSVKESRDEHPRKVDFLGASLAVVALAGITYGLIEGPGSHWAWHTITALIVGVIFLALFIAAEYRQRDPMMNLRLFASRNFSGANITTFAMYGGLSGFFFALIIHLQVVVGYTSMAAGLSTIPVTILLLLFSGRMGRLTAKYGPRIFMTLGPIIAGIGMLSLLGLEAGANYWFAVLPGVSLFGIGLVLTVAPLTVTVMSSVSDAQSGIASGVNNAISRAAGLIVIALLGVFGANNSYQFTLILCSILAFIAGIGSYLLIRNQQRNT